MDIPLFTEELQKKDKKKRKHDDSVLQSVLSRFEPVADVSVTQSSSRTPALVAAPAAQDAKPMPDKDVLDPTVPLNVHLSGIPARAKKCHVEAFLLEAIEITELVEVRLVADKETGAHRGFGFVELRTHEAAAKVLALNDTDFLGSSVTVRPARQKGKAGEGERRFGSLDYTAIAVQVDKSNKRRVAEQIERGEKARAEFLAKKAEKEEEQRQFLAAGGKLPGGFGFGFGSSGRPKLHGGYANFEM